MNTIDQMKTLFVILPFLQVLISSSLNLMYRGGRLTWLAAY